MIKTIIYILTILSFSFKARAQNFNINVLPARLIYNSNQRFDLLLLFKYAEIERKINEHYSISLGIYYSKEKEENILGGYRNLLYDVNSNLRYYFNKRNNISGFYGGTGFNFANFRYETKGRFASIDGVVLERNRNVEVVEINLSTGYKFVLINKRFSVDFKLNQAFNLLSKETIKILGASGNQVITTSNPNQNIFGFPVLDLKLGYRFGFKK